MRAALTGSLVALLTATLGLTACGSTSTGSATRAPSSTSTSTAIGMTTSTDTRYYLDLATADPALSTYVDGAGSGVALKALLADGVAFCEVIYKGDGIDDAMTSVVEGADSVESTTHLPRSVRTFNAIDSAALLALCPSAQKRIPASDRASLRQLARAIAASGPATP